MNRTHLEIGYSHVFKDIEIQRNADFLVIKNEALSRILDLSQIIPRTASFVDRKTGREYISPDASEGDFTFMGYNMPFSKGTTTKYHCRSVEIERRSAGLFDGGGVVIRLQVEEDVQQLCFIREYYLYHRLPVIASRCGIKAAVSPNLFWSRRSASFDRGDASHTLMESRVESLKLAPEINSFRVVKFSGRTDFTNNLVTEQILCEEDWTARGNILFGEHTEGGGFFVLQEAPLSDERRDLEDHDFRYTGRALHSCCWGISPHEVNPENILYSYRNAIGLFDSEDRHGQKLLKDYLRIRFPQATKENDVIMVNPWGSGTFTGDLSEQYLIEEIAATSQIGATHYEIDDGWQAGMSLTELHLNNRAAGEEFWQISKSHFPRGLDGVCDAAARYGIGLGLWVAPSFNKEFRDWRLFVQILGDFHRKYGIRIFKVDGVSIRTKEAEDNLESMVRELRTISNGDIVFDIDTTAGQRVGYFLFQEYGKIFLENRYSCHHWGQVYHPEQVLKNLWRLSRYIRTQALQIEVTSYSKINRAYYDHLGVSHPDTYPLPYWLAVPLFANPLVWLAPSKLDLATRAIYREGLRLRRQYGHQIAAGEIFPIGNEPDGRSVTGFLSHHFETATGFLIIFRELGGPSQATLKLPFVGNRHLLLKSLSDNSPSIGKHCEADLEVTLNLPASFRVYQYSCSQ